MNLTISVQGQDGSQQDAWTSLDTGLRGSIKDALLQVLASPDKQTTKAVATCLAIIAAVEVPAGLDEQFLQNFSGLATQEGQSFQTKLTAIQTLGLMCEFIDTIGNKLQPG